MTNTDCPVCGETGERLNGDMRRCTTGACAVGTYTVDESGTGGTDA